jgi:hypothetical protein
MAKVAIYPDVIEAGGQRMSFSERWAELARASGHHVRVIDPRSPDIVGQVVGCDAFMWRFHRRPAERLQGKRLVPAIKFGLGIPVYPDVVTCWYYDDKIAMHYLLNAVGIPTPRTRVCWRRTEAIEFCRSASYPLVLKLATGCASNNVRLVRTCAEAEEWSELLFDGGLLTMKKPRLGPREVMRRLKQVLPRPVRRFAPKTDGDLQSHYLLVQEFLPGNEFDTRITVIGNRAFGFRRFNRPGDFRASGSGRFDHDPTAIEEDAVRLAFRVAQRCGFQAVAVDILRHEGRPVLVEIGYDYVNWVVNACPGHWTIDGDADAGQLRWREGRTRSEDAIYTDFAACLDPADVPPAPADVS